MNPKQLDSSFGSFQGKNNSSTGSIKNNKTNVLKVMDKKRGSGNINSYNNNNINKSNASINFMNNSNSTIYSSSKYNQNNTYNSNEQNSTKYKSQNSQEFQNQNKVFKQLQYADQKNVFHRLSKQSPLKYEGSVRSAHQDMKKQNNSNVKIENDTLEIKYLLFKENNKALQNQINKQNGKQSQSPKPTKKQIEIKQQQSSLLKQNNSFSNNSKSPKAKKETNSKNENNQYNQLKQLHQHLNCYLGNHNQKKPEYQEDNQILFTPYKRSNSSETYNSQKQSHPRSKTELLTRSTSPEQRLKSDDCQEIYNKMQEIECEQKELEMKKNILDQYKKLLQHKIQTKNKKQATQIKDLKKNLQINLNKMCEDTSEFSNDNSKDITILSPIPKEESKKQIRWQLNNPAIEQKNSSLKNSPSRKNSQHNSNQNYSEKKKGKHEKNDINNISSKQKTLLSDCVKKMKGQKYSDEKEQHKPIAPTLLMKKLMEKGKQVSENPKLNERQQNRSSTPTQFESQNQKNRSTSQLQQARQEFIKKCQESKKPEEIYEQNNGTDQQRNEKYFHNNNNKAGDSYNYTPSFFNQQQNIFMNKQVQLQNFVNQQQNETINYLNLEQNQTINPIQQQQNIFSCVSPRQNQPFNPIQQFPSNIGEINTCTTVSYVSAREDGQNKIPSLPNFMMVSENQWTTPVCSKTTIQPQCQQNSNSQLYSNQIIQKKDQPIQNNYSSYTIYSNPQPSNRYEEDNQESDLNDSLNQNINQNNIGYEKSNQNHMIPCIIITEPKETFTDFSKLEGQQNSPSQFQNLNKYNYIKQTPQLNNIINNQSENGNNTFQSYNYIQQMIEQKSSTQNKNFFAATNNLKNAYRELQEPEGDLNTNFKYPYQQQKELHVHYADDLEEGKCLNQLQKQNITSKNKSTDKIQNNVPVFIQKGSNQQSKNYGNGIKDNRIQINQQKQQQSKGFVQQPGQKNKETKVTQGIFSARRAAGEQQYNKKDYQSKQCSQNQEDLQQFEKLLQHTIDEDLFDIENQKLNGNDLSSNKSRLIREASLKSEKLQLLQFQLQEQLVINLEEEEKKTSYNSSNVNIDDISQRNTKWLSNKEEKIKKQKEQKNRKELDGCTFKPNLIAQKFQQDSKNSSRLTSTQQLDQQLKQNGKTYNSSNFLRSITKDDDQSSVNERVPILAKSQFGSSQILSKQNTSPQSYYTKYKSPDSQSLEKKQQMTYQMINFKKRGSLHKID